MTNSTPETGSTPPSGAPIPLGAIIGIVVVAIVGVAMLVFALLSLFNTGSQPTSVAQLTVTATHVILIPTVTSAPLNAPTEAPSAAPAPTQLPAGSPTDTPAGPTPVPVTDTPSGPVLTIIIPANVRSGPGVNYPVIGGLQAGSTPEVVGRDSSGNWYVVGSQGGQGWVSGQVAQYSGDTNALPVMTAPPPPPTAPPTPVPTNTSAPAAPTAPVGSAQGVRGDYFRLQSSSREFAINQDIWFEFQVTNTSGNRIPYRCLGAKIPGSAAQCSWGNGPNDALGPNQVITWNDHINIGTAGTYTLVLGICYLGDTGACKSSGTNGWEYLSPGIQITVK